MPHIPFKLKSSLRSRRLFLMVAFLFNWSGSDINPIPYSFVTDDAAKAADDILHEDHSIYRFLDLTNNWNKFETVNHESYHEKPVWFVDTTRGLCLGPHGFGECGDVTIWKLKELRSGEVRIVSVLESNNAMRDQPQCLGRHLEFSSEHYTVSIQNCKRASYLDFISWAYNIQTGQLAVKPRLFTFGLTEAQCLVDHVLGPRLQPCSKGYTRLSIVVHDSHEPQSIAATTRLQKGQHDQADLQCAEDIHLNSGRWIHQGTNLVFPRNLDDTIPKRDAKGVQVLMGGDVFKKRVFGYDFSVYVVAMYVDAVAAQKDPTLLSFKSMSSAELALSERFYAALSKPAAYDRSLMIKLAMNLKTEMMVTGLVEELKVSKRNSEILQKASRLYTLIDCPRDLEIIFTWRHFDSKTGHRDVLEIRIGGVLLASLHEPGLAEDFFWQFVNDDPVSHLAKLAFTRGFPHLIGPDAVPASSGLAGCSENAPQSVATGLDAKDVSPTSNILFAVVSRVYSVGYRSWRLWRYTVKRNRLLNEKLAKLLVHRRATAASEEQLAAAIILLNALVLIMISLPPGVISKQAKAVERTVRKRTVQAKAVVSNVTNQIQASASSITKTLSNSNIQQLMALR